MEVDTEAQQPGAMSPRSAGAWARKERQQRMSEGNEFFADIQVSSVEFRLHVLLTLGLHWPIVWLWSGLSKWRLIAKQQSVEFGGIIQKKR